MSVDTAEIAMEQEEVSKSSDPNAPHQKIARKGAVVTWSIEHFSHWHVGPSGDLSSGVFAILDGTQWRIVLRRSTLEPLLIRVCPKGPSRVRVGFQFSLLTDSNSAVHVTDPLIRTFRDKTEEGSGRLLDAEIFAKREMFLPGDTLTLQCHLWRERCNHPRDKRCTFTLHLGQLASSMEHTLMVFSQTPDCRAKTGSPESCEASPLEKVRSLFLSNNHFQEDDSTDEVLRLTLTLQKNVVSMSRNRMILLNPSNGLPVISSPVVFHHFLAEQESFQFPLEFQKSLITDNMDRGIIRIWYDLVMWTKSCQSTARVSKRSYSISVAKKLRSTLSSDMRRLLSSVDGCPGDMSVVSGDGVSLCAHRVILCTRSLVFEAMMERDMSERQSGVVLIDDMGGKALKQLLSFLYTGRLEEEDALDSDTLAELYNAGDKYRVLPLKKRCSVLLSGRVTAENACDVLEFSDLHSDRSMRDPALSVLCSRAEDILISEEWQGLADRKRLLAEEILEEVRMKRIKKS